MSVLKAFVRHLISKPYDGSKIHRKDFYSDPSGTMGAFRHERRALTDEEKSVIVTLDYRLIAEYAADAALTSEIRDFVDHNDQDDDWEDPGDPRWDPWENERKCRQPALESQGSVITIWWSGPQSRITHLFKDRAAPGERFDLRIAGEGLLAGASVVLQQLEKPHRRLSSTANDYIPCNIRRSYISAPFSIPKDAATGNYSVIVWNKGWKKHRLYWAPFVIA